MAVLFLICVLVILAVVCVAVWCHIGIGWCTSDADLMGKTVVITGANTGLGYITALDMARRNARVILICRNVECGTEAIERIKQETGNRNIILKKADLSSLASVRNVAEEINAEESRLDILINNAGVIAGEKIMTEDGFEYSFATNHLGPFLLTNLLLDLLKKSTPSRIVILSSSAQKFGKIDFDNLNAEKSFSHTSTYFNTKLMNVLFTKQLAKVLEDTGVTANCLHPGVIYTGLFRYMPAIVNSAIFVCSLLFCKTPVEGAQTSIHCAVSEKAAGITGRYFMDCKVAEDGLNHLAHDEGIAKKLWEVSERFTGLISE